MNTRERVLKEALNCVNGEREKQYGSPEDNFRRIADLWSVYLTSLFEDEKIVVDIDPIDVAKMMILFKIARSNGDKDKLDNYVDILGYGACAAEIFENGEEHPTTQPCDYIEVAEECRNCDYAKKCMGTGVCLKETEKKCVKNCENILDNFADFVNERVRKKTEEKEKEKKCLLDNKDSYSYVHDKLANYVSVKAKEENVPLDNLKSIDRKFPRELEELLDKSATDYVSEGEYGRLKLLDYYKKIDELFAKYVKKGEDKKDSTSLFNIYISILADILSFSTSANVDPFDIVWRLTINGHAPTDMAALVLSGKLNVNCVVHYIEDAIHEAKENKK